MKRGLLFLFILLLISSCHPYKKLNLSSIKLTSVELKSTSKVSFVLTAEVENENEKAISLEDFNGVLFHENNEFALVDLKEPVSVMAGEKASIDISLEAKLIDPLSLLSMGLNIETWDIDDFRVSSKATLRAEKGRKKTLRIKNMPLEKLINSF